MGPGIYTGDAEIDNISYNLLYTSALIGRSIVGIRAGDVVRLVQLLKKNYDINEVYGVARKEMAPVLLHAAAFDTDISRIALIGSYSSYKSIVMNRFYSPEFVFSTVPGAMTAYDLPDLAASLAPRNLLMIGTTDGNGKNTDQNIINDDLKIISDVYQAKKAGEKLKIVSQGSTGKPDELFPEWIK